MFGGPLPPGLVMEPIEAAAVQEVWDPGKEMEKQWKEDAGKVGEDAATLLVMRELAEGYTFELFMEDWWSFLAAHTAANTTANDGDCFPASSVSGAVDTATCMGTCEQCVQFLKNMQ